MIEQIEKILRQRAGVFLLQDRDDLEHDGCTFTYVARDRVWLVHDLSLNQYSTLTEFVLYKRAEHSTQEMSWLMDNCVACGHSETGEYFWIVNHKDVDFFQLHSPLEYMDAVEVFDFH